MNKMINTACSYTSIIPYRPIVKKCLSIFTFVWLLCVMLAIDIDFKENNIIIPFLQQDIYTHKTNNNNENEPKENENKI